MMRHAFASISSVLLFAFFSVSMARAKFDLPDYVYAVSQLNEAQAKAKSSNKPIAFIHSNKDTRCALATAASTDVFQRLKDCSILVYAEQGELNSLPAVAGNALRSPDAGEFIPQTVVVNEDMDQLICILPYAGQERRGKMLDEVRRIIAAAYRR